MASCQKLIAFRDFNPVDPFDGHHAAVGAVPIDCRNFVAINARHILRKLARGRSLAAKVEFGIGPALKVGNRRARTQSLGFVAHDFNMSRGPFVGLDVLCKLLADAGAKDFDSHFAPVCCDTLVNLRDGSRAHRLWVDFRKQRFQRLVERGFNRLAD